MGFLRDVGKFAGQAAGFVVGGAVNVVGEITGSKFIKEVGDGVKKASEFAGDTVGQIADGAWNTAAGMIQEDHTKRDQGLKDMGDSIGRTAKGVYHTAKNTYHNGKDIYDGFKSDDDDKIKKGVSSLAKTVAVGALAIGVVDFVDGIDGVDTGDVSADPDLDDTSNGADAQIHQADLDSAHSQVAVGTDDVAGDPGLHTVKPHWVEGHYQNGNWIDGYWRDGDGDTSVDLTEEQGGGYLQSNPDGNPNNNLG
jgi:hypothetical protein